MAFENLRAQIDMLLEDAQDRPDSLYAIYQKVMQEINELRALGMPLPEDLVDLENALEEKFAGDAPEPGPSA